MKLVIQRVNRDLVEVAETKKKVGEIEKGMLVLLGVGEEDSEREVEKLVNKLVKLRIMADEKGKMNLNILDAGGEVLIVSQFTLYADTSGGNRPSFIKAAKLDKARELYQLFVSRLREYGVKTKTGSFGANMIIYAELDGPVTIIQ